jgi:hypothetical protein
MNSQATMSFLRQALTLIGGLLAGAGWISAGQSADLVSDITIAVPALLSAGSILWSVYSHFNMKKVPVAATALILPPVAPGVPSALPAVGTTINLTPMIGVAKVVG